jgi:DNA-binding Lrp family transcriptional regulator
MDALDLKIIKLLEKNSRMTNTEIASKLKVSEGTIRKRIYSMLEKEIIKRFTVDLGTKSGFIAFVLINSKPNAILAKTIEKIKSMPETRRVFEVTGNVDLVVEITAESAEKFNEIIDVIRAMPKIERTQSLIVLKTTF